jgi:multidrug efflux system membrane fusion protein
MTETADTKKSPAPRRRRRRLLWIAGAALAILIALILWHLLHKPPAKGVPPQVVKVAQAAKGDMPVILNELGTVTPNATVTVVPNQAVSGYLTEVPFKEGQDVQKDQLLAQIDPRPFEVSKAQAEAQLAKDQATLDQARSDLARFTRLNALKSIAEQTFVDQKFIVEQDAATVKADQANIAQFALDIAYCHITAPVAGRVGLRLVDAGNYITGSSNTGLAVVTTMKPTTVQFTVAQNDLDAVVERFNTAGVKLPVTAYTSDNGKQLGTGTLYALNNQMTTSTGTVTLRATFPNDDEALFPSEFVNIRLLVDTMKGAVLVPTTAVLSGAPGNYVYLVNKDAKDPKDNKDPKDDKDAKDDKDNKGNAGMTVSVHPVTLGPSDGKNTVITKGLNVGDTVVTDGTDRLTDGAKIKIAAPTDGKAPAAPGSPPSTKQKDSSDKAPSDK